MAALIFNVFFVPDNLVASGVSGLSIIVDYIFDFDPFIFMLIVNVFLIFAAYFLLGKKDAIKSALGSLLFPIFIKITSYLIPYISLNEVDTLVKCLFGGFLYGFAFGLIFKSGFNTGGTDIIESILSKYLKISMDKSIILVDGLIVILCAFTLGIEHMIYALTILICMGVYANKFMLEINDDKVLFVTTGKSREVKDYLAKHYDYGMTLFDAQGGYTHKEFPVLMVSVKRNYYYEIKEHILSIDPNAFISVSNSYETVYINKEKRNKVKRA